MAGAIDVPGNLEPACDSFRCAPYFFPHCTEDMGWCEVCDPEVSGHCTGFPEWNVFVDPYATAYLFTETSFPIAIVPLDVCEKLRASVSSKGPSSRIYGVEATRTPSQAHPRSVHGHAPRR